MRETNNSPKIMGIDDLELKMIELIAQGLTYTEISEKLKLEENKVENIRKNLIIKTRTKNTASLVSFAYKYGLLKV
ncbi:MAG: LuxR family transcriptional regulator [Chryseobacterium sp.]|uniref:LuxR C-terminal-related transcriptional regulator n=1 Tax=Pedobacter agri TaxID=454586 RepID=A0A9X3DAU1_9SPHI|nr:MULTISPECIES: LuxR C-terminal-related transcriptional regulator [Pedobacter]AZI25765.1 LuxR family transcriptional regulator [Pedobacter sp. G11]MCX3263761.1 LuxR C-terminal-related transcriptional regulator [Pedobacter agri]MDQ1141800.1 DNA-binding CsgD family transcriptional regulator [Pedobacter agri]RZJ92159.1 MAG: LuxR family transcriptional regulator [Chryseobacterium sp.]